jgi:hypothetical protein
MSQTQTAKIQREPVLIVQTGNNFSPELVDSSYATNEAYRLKEHTTLGIDGKGKESVNVSLAKKEGIENELMPKVLEVKGKDISLKLGILTKGDKENKEEYSFIYDNYNKDIVGIYKKTNEGLATVSKEDYLVAPDKKLGHTLNERIQTV